MERAQGALLVAVLLGVLPARAETLASLYLGVSYTHPGTVRLRQEGGTDLRLRGVQWASEPLTRPLYYGLRVSYLPDDDASLGVMLDFVHDKVISDPAQQVQVEGLRAGQPVQAREPVGQSLERFRLTHGANHLTLHLVFRFGGCARPAPCRARLRPYASSGLGVLVPHVEATVRAGREQGSPAGGSRADGYQLTGPSWQGALGLLSPEWLRTALLGEYRLSRARLHAELPGGSVDTHLLTHHLLLGPSFRVQ